MSTHQQLLYHVVFSTKHRKRTLANGFREEVFTYMAATCRELAGYALIVGGYFNHVHLLVRIPTKTAVADFVRQLKANTSKHINQTKRIVTKFSWQEGYGAFTVSVSNKDLIYQYIENQMQHHTRVTFENEYVGLLKEHQIDYDERYLWE